MRKPISVKVSIKKENDILRMNANLHLLKDIHRATGVSLNLINKILDAHGVRRPQHTKSNGVPTLCGKSIILQCAELANENHKKLTKLMGKK